MSPNFQKSTRLGALTNGLSKICIASDTINSLLNRPKRIDACVQGYPYSRYHPERFCPDQRPGYIPWARFINKYHREGINNLHLGILHRQFVDPLIRQVFAGDYQAVLERN